MTNSNLIAAHFDHQRAYGNFSYVYPVISRRTGGVSIGINLNPDKVCNFDCIYCEVNRTAPSRPRRKTRVDLDVLMRELREMLHVFRRGELFAREPFVDAPPEWRGLRDIAFSGDGEPTICPLFEQAVQAVWHVRESLGLRETPLVLITDASCLDRPGVRRGLIRLLEGGHEIWAKLDAGTDDYYHTVNRSRVPYATILKNILETSCWCPLVIQSLFVRIAGRSPPEEEIRAFASRLNEITGRGGKILRLQLCTMARPGATAFATPLADAELARIGQLVREQTGLPLDLFYGAEQRN